MSVHITNLSNYVNTLTAAWRLWTSALREDCTANFVLLLCNQSMAKTWQNPL